MNFKKKYRITLEDETTLEKRVDISARFSALIIFSIAIVILAGALGIFIFASTPMKNLLPGYLKKSERTATEEQHIRLDSLVKVYEVNEAYIKGVLNALNPTDKSLLREKSDRSPVALSVDSILPISEEEKAFMESIRERDKYNIGYASPVAAGTLMFGSVNKAAVISQKTKNNYQAELIIPAGSHVTTIAEGKVISIASSPKAAGGYEVIIQHPNGFLSKTSRLTHLMIKPGDRVAAGQIIAGGTSSKGLKDNHVMFELWRDGDPLIPSRYLNGGESFKN